MDKTSKLFTPDRQKPAARPPGATNAIIVLLDDVRFGQSSTFGSLRPTLWHVIGLMLLAFGLGAGSAWAQTTDAHEPFPAQTLSLSYAYPTHASGSDAHAGDGDTLSAGDDRTSIPDSTATAGAPASTGQPHEGESLAEINNKLNNPGADLASLNFKFTWNQYQGSLGGAASWGERLRSFKPHQPIRNLSRFARSFRGEGASSQNSLTLDFQPVFPFPLDDQGSNFLVRPTIPIVWQPSYNAQNRRFDENFGLGDSQLVMFYANTNKKTGFFWGAGPTMQFPTHTDDALGTDAFLLGPAGYCGIMGKWGILGVFPQHWWNIGGGDGYTAFTAIQPFYWFDVGKGYQIGGAPIITYNWAADESDQAWTVPVNLGVGKTVKIGKLPVKFKFEAIYYVEQPDAFGPHWGLQLTITPVIPNPFEALLAKR